jgi:hypothetical protein
MPAFGILRYAMTGTLLMDSSLLANAETVVARARTGDPEALGGLY